MRPKVLYSATNRSPFELKATPCAYCAGGVKVGQLHAFCHHAVHARRLKMFLAEGGEVSVAGVVNHYVNKVGFAGKGTRNVKNGEENNRK